MVDSQHFPFPSQTVEDVPCFAHLHGEYGSSHVLSQDIQGSPGNLAAVPAPITFKPDQVSNSIPIDDVCKVITMKLL
jgi:hypothetical protein